MLLTVGSAVLLLGVLIFMHELGHFLAAKAVGMGVHRFSLGLGSPSPLKLKWGETEYAISWIPFGGYVKVASKGDVEQGFAAELEGGQEEMQFPPERYFENKPYWARLTFVTAGVVMNLLVAYGIYTGLAKVYGLSEDPTTRLAAVDTAGLPAVAQPLLGVPMGTEILKVNGDTIQTWDDITDAVTAPSGDRLRFDFAPPVPPVVLPIPATHSRDRFAVWQAMQPMWEPRIGLVAAGHPAARAGLKVKDLVVAVGGDSVHYWQQMVHVIESHAGDSVPFTVRRGDSVLHLAIVPDAEEVRSLDGTRRTVGKIGIGPLITPRDVRFTMARAMVEGGRQTWGDFARFWTGLAGLVSGHASTKDIASPILIGEVAGERARLGIAPFLAFMALISVNLAGLNILPIPLLDGGHILFLGLEAVRRKPVPLALRIRLTQIGLVLLLAIAGVAVVNDLVKLWPWV